MAPNVKGTGQVGRPTTSDGYIDAGVYADDPDNEIVADFTHHDRPNTAFAYCLAIIKDLWDAVAVLTNTIPGITLYPQYIEDDLTVPANYDGITASRGVAVGYTVEVAPGSILTHISEEPMNVEQIQVTTNLTIEDFSGDYAALLSDASKTKRNTGAAATFTIDTVANVSWSVGDNVAVVNEGSGDITLTAASGVTFIGNGTTLGNGGASVTLVMTSADSWTIIGETA